MLDRKPDLYLSRSVPSRLCIAISETSSDAEYRFRHGVGHRNGRPRIQFPCVCVPRFVVCKIYCRIGEQVMQQWRKWR